MTYQNYNLSNLSSSENLLLKFEIELVNTGKKYICGVDEVGRGPLAGSVVVCAAIMDLSKIIDGVNDSKKLSEKVRLKLYPCLLESAIDYCIFEVPPARIDEINILNATKEAMIGAVMGLKVKPDIVLIDAVELTLPYETMSIIKGDAKSYSIAAASIIAKVSRDAQMLKYHKLYPDYNFVSNKGYGTKDHLKALKEVGPCPIHRKSFIKKLV